MQEHVLVLEASLKQFRYSNIATKTLLQHNHKITAVGNREGYISDIQVKKEIPENPEKVDTITLYLGPSNQKEYYDKILQLKPRRIIFNPGTENKELEKLARENNIETMESCTIIMLNEGTF